MDKIKLPECWKKVLQEEFTKKYMLELKKFLLNQYSKKTVYPPANLIFTALNETHFENVKVVILGQDPYHGPGQAHGLSFSVPNKIAPPPSLKNIFQELNRDLGMPIPRHGNLISWAKQGVLLLNTVLTVEKSRAGSHRQKGWENFTDQIIKKLNNEREHLVFLLWGRPAQNKEALLDTKKHLVLKSSHPSPLSAFRGFLGCGHFSQTNKHLIENKIDPINWNSL